MVLLPDTTFCYPTIARGEPSTKRCWPSTEFLVEIIFVEFYSVLSMFGTVGAVTYLLPPRPSCFGDDDCWSETVNGGMNSFAGMPRVSVSRRSRSPTVFAGILMTCSFSGGLFSAFFSSTDFSSLVTLLIPMRSSSITEFVVCY